MPRSGYGNYLRRQKSTLKNYTSPLAALKEFYLVVSPLSYRFSNVFNKKQNENCLDHSNKQFWHFIYMIFVVFISKVTTVQLNNNTDHIWGGNALRNEFSNGTLLWTLEQQQDKGTRGIGLCFRKVLLSLREVCVCGGWGGFFEINGPEADFLISVQLKR